MLIRIAVVVLPCVLAATNLARAEELPELPLDSGPLCFAVLGDTHYTPPDFKVALHIHAIAEEIRRMQPAVRFVCQTGDIVEGGTYQIDGGKRRFVRANYDEMRSQLQFAIRDLTESLGRPVFIAVGNHDKHDPGHKAYNDTILPVMARQLQRPAAALQFAFHCGNARFVFLDYAPDDYASQAQYLEAIQSDVRRAPAGEHLFVFAHFPLWAVVRAGFFNPRLSESLLPQLTRGPLDAFFCGHTHDATLCVRQFAGRRVTQIQGISTASSKASPLLPLEEHRALLFPAAEAPYCWGYIEGSATGYHLVRIEGKKVHVQWRVPGRGVLYEYGWEKPGELIDIQRPAAPHSPQVTAGALKNARQAALILCPWCEEPTSVEIRLNGRPITQAQLGPTYSMFWEDKRITIPKEKLDVIGPENRLEIGNPSRAIFGVAHARLEVVLADGTQVVTMVSSDFCFSAKQSDIREPARQKGWRAAPPAMVKEVELGQSLGPMQLELPLR